MQPQQEQINAAHRDEQLELARGLVAALEFEDYDEARRCMQQLNLESAMYKQVGKIAREVHENMLAFLSGSELRNMTQGETEETRKRLSHVLEMTDSAAHETLAAAEVINDSLRHLQGARAAGALDDAALGKALEDIHHKVNGIVLAQSYQDLSGQIITRAITLVSNIEAQLIDLLTLAGIDSPEETVAAMSATAAGGDRGFGPRVAGTTTGDALAGQDEVDDLLTSLGF